MLKFIVVLALIAISHPVVRASESNNTDDCENIILRTKSGNVQDFEIYRFFAYFENQLNSISKTGVEQKKLDQARTTLEELEAEFLILQKTDSRDELIIKIRKLSYEVQWLMKKAHLSGQHVEASSIEDLVRQPKLLLASTQYANPGRDVHTVVFEARAASEFLKLDNLIQIRYMRAIAHGIARAKGENGVKYLREVNIWEVKCIRTNERLIGCLKDGVLTIKRRFVRSDQATGEFNSFAGMCD